MVLARGETASFTVMLDAEAARNLALPLEVVGGAGLVTVPAAVSIPKGEISGRFDVEGLAAGGPVTIRVGLGESKGETQIHVVPRIASLAPAAPVQTYGQNQLFTVTLETPAPTAVELAISADPPGAVTLPSVVTMPADTTTQTFSVVGSHLGGPIAVRAAIGEHVAEAKVRVVGLWISEAMYNPSNGDDQKEWVELYNASGVSVDLTGMGIVAWLEPVNGALGGWQPVAKLLSGSIGANGCGAVGGPLKSPDSGLPASFPFIVGVDFSPDLGNAALRPASALGLRSADGLFIDAVIYGASNAELDRRRERGSARQRGRHQRPNRRPVDRAYERGRQLGGADGADAGQLHAPPAVVIRLPGHPGPYST